MELFRYNKENVIWYKKIDWIKVLLSFILSFFLFFMFFYYISNQSNIESVFFTSFLIGFLIAFNTYLSDLLENRDRVFILDKKSLGYLEIHKEISGKFLKTSDFYNILNKEELEDLYNKNYLYEGIDKGEIKNICFIKKKPNCIIIKAYVKEKRWKSTSKFVISKVYIIEKNYKKKIIIPNDFDEYNKLYRLLKERVDKNV